MSKKLLFLIFFIVLLLGFIGIFGLYEVKFFSSRASIKTSEFSKENSYVFITPLRARANGQEKIRLTVFLLNDQGLGVSGKNVSLAQDEALNIENIQAITDNYGKSYFDISANKSGEYYIKVLVDDNDLNQNAHLSFY